MPKMAPRMTRTIVLPSSTPLSRPNVCPLWHGREIERASVIAVRPAPVEGPFPHDGRSLFEQIEVVNGVVVTDVAKFDMVGANEFEDHPVSLIHSETPDVMALGMQFFGVKRRVKRIALKQVRFGDGLSLDGGRKFLEESIKRGGGRDFDHLEPLCDQFPQRVPWGDPSCAMVPVRSLQRV